MTILEIEEKYNVEHLKVNGFFLWPYVRNYIGYTISTNTDGQVQVTSKNILYLISSLFYGVFNFFKKTDYIFSSSSDQKKMIQGKYVDRMDFYIDKLPNSKYLFIDLPNPKHFDRNIVKTKNISSKIWFYLFEKIAAKFIPLKFENEAVLKTILSENNLNINYHALSKKMLSQYYVSSLFFKWKKPKMFFVTTAYTNAARIKAANDLNIKTIEFQHGIISKTHVAYTLIKNIDSSFHPKYLLTFGEKELEVFNKKNCYIDVKNVIPIGSYYIDFLNKSPQKEHKLIQQIRTSFTKIVSFSCQKPFDHLSMPFIIEAAKINKQIAYIIMPRFFDKTFFDSFKIPENIFFIHELNTYEKILQTDIHSTIFSTTAIEALSLGKPNILLNIDDLPTRHFKNIITENKFTYIVNTPVEMVEKILEISNFSKSEIINSNSSNFMPNFENNVTKTLNIIEK